MTAKRVDVNYLKKAVLGKKCGSLWKNIPQQIRDLKKVEDNWDGEGALKPSKESINAVIAFLAYLYCKNFPAPDGVYQGNGDDIMIYWDFDCVKRNDLIVSDCILSAEIFGKRPNQTEILIGKNRLEPTNKDSSNYEFVIIEF